MSIKDMKLYMNHCIEGPSTIPQRKEMLNKSRKSLLKKVNELNEYIDFIDNKQSFYNDVLNGKTKYISNLIDIENT
ncbi:hypothetical protein [Clostridium sp. 1001271B_151109_B4]|uniref:hypothetical protein n=1 Tax=Clostridium sp. 1001271B_151109_B4 TaxID=2787148 RepID=UPI001A9AE3E4|nr:hypothetical protein [Clostridium sp. 1001271B_151109_B4]